jgi:hypothetical protein
MAGEQLSHRLVLTDSIHNLFPIAICYSSCWLSLVVPPSSQGVAIFAMEPLHAKDSAVHFKVPKFPVCSLCCEPVELGTAKTDADGKAIHEERYALCMKGALLPPPENSSNGNKPVNAMKYMIGGSAPHYHQSMAQTVVHVSPARYPPRATKNTMGKVLYRPQPRVIFVKWGLS